MTSCSDNSSSNSSKFLNPQQIRLLSKTFGGSAFIFFGMFIANLLINEYFGTILNRAKNDSYVLLYISVYAVATTLVGIIILILVTRKKIGLNGVTKRSNISKLILLIQYGLCLGVGIGLFLNLLSALLPDGLVTRLSFVLLVNALSFLVLGLFGGARINKVGTSFNKFVLVGGISTLFFGIIIALMISFIWLPTAKGLNFVYLICGSVVSFSMIGLIFVGIKKEPRFNKVDSDCRSEFIQNLVIVFAAMLVNTLVGTIYLSFRGKGLKKLIINVSV